MKTRVFPYLMLLKVSMLTAILTKVHGLECYSCVTSQAPDCLSSARVTCATGQVCFNTVYRRGYSLGLLYTKGCEDELQCIRLANLNSASYCDHAPSQCQHCCFKDLCNTGAPGLVGISRAIHVLLFVFSSLTLKLFSMLFL